MKKSRPWNLNKESILKPSFNTFISPHKIIDISARVDKKKNSFNNRYKSNIFKDCVNFICYSEFFFILVLICGWTFSSHGRLSELIN